MDNPTILVADGDPKNLQILRESLEASGFEVIVASDGLQAWQKISSDVPDLILSEVNLPKLDGFQLLEKLKADPVTSSIPLMFLTNRRELQDRVRSLRGGVKDYMIKPLHVKEVIARVRMILRRMERIREEEIESTRKLAGRLDELSVIDLIESLGMERKTGVLTLFNANNKCGEIYFRDGAVVNASLGNLKAEKAVYQMLPWKRGHFTMIFKEINIPDEISVSNLGLLLHGFKRMEERERLFKMLPSPETTFVTTETFRNILQKREVTTDVAKFIALIDGKRDILQIIDESTYDDIKTLERLVKLYQQGFIKPGKTTIAGQEEIDDIASSIAEPKIVEQLVIGPSREQRFVNRNLPEAKTPPASPRETTRWIAPQAFRSPDLIPPTPPSRNRKDRPGMPPAPQPRHSDPFERPDWDQESSKPNFPDALPPKQDSEDEAIEPAQIFLEPLQHDEPSQDLDWPGEPARSGAERHEEETEPPSDDQEIPISTIERSMPSTARSISPEEESAAPEHLSIDLSALTQRPIAPPRPDAKMPPPIPSPAKGEPPVIKARTEKPHIAPPPEVKRIEAKPREPIAPAPHAEPEIAPEARTKIEPVAEPAVEPLPKAKTAIGIEIESAPPRPAPKVIEAKKFSREQVPPPAATATAPDARPYPADAISSRLALLLKNRAVQRPKLIVIGREGIQVSPMVRHLLGAESTLRRLQSNTFQYLEIGERKLSGSHPFEVIGISMEQQFTRLLDAAGEEVVGYIVIIEAYRKENLEYLSYLLNVLKTVYRQPLGIAVIKSPDHKNMATDTLRDLLNVEPADFVQECTPADESSVIEFLNGFTSDSNLQRQ
jgi:CheY-like chemotaxis protein